MLFVSRSRKKCARLHRMRCTKTYDVGVTLGRVCAACGTEVVRVRHRFRANLEKNAGIRYKSFAMLTRNAATKLGRRAPRRTHDVGEFCDRVIGAFSFEKARGWRRSRSKFASTTREFFFLISRFFECFSIFVLAKGVRACIGCGAQKRTTSA